MEKEIQEAIDKLEALQYAMILWGKEEKSKKRKKLLKMYDVHIESVIDILYEYGIAD